MAAWYFVGCIKINLSGWVKHDTQYIIKFIGVRYFSLSSSGWAAMALKVMIKNHD